ncbi:MAG: hypothetical protein AAGH15_03255 [Myxococcota bacterium]
MGEERPERDEARVLFEAEHLRLTEDPALRALWFTRLPTRPDDPAELLQDYRLAVGYTGPLHRGYTAIIDAREAPGRQDAAYEPIGLRIRGELARRYARVVVLLQSVAGVLHARRFQSRDQLPIEIVRSVEEAMAIAAGARERPSDRAPAEGSFGDDER